MGPLPLYPPSAFLSLLSAHCLAHQYFNMRLAPEDVSDSLSGFQHNAVSPVGMKTPLPIIISHRYSLRGGGQ